jgi:hypothetical protein
VKTALHAQTDTNPSIDHLPYKSGKRPTNSGNALADQSPACLARTTPPREVHYPPRTRGHSSLFVPILSPPIQLIQDRRGRFASCGPKSRGQRAEAGVPARAATGALALLAADHGRADGSRPSGRGARRRCTSACLDSRSTPAYPARWALFEGLWHVGAGARVAASSVSRCQGAKQWISELIFRGQT